MTRLLQLKRKKGSNAFLAIVPHLKWTIPVVVRLLRCIHYLASPEGRKLLGVCEGALTIGEIINIINPPWPYLYI